MMFSVLLGSPIMVEGQGAELPDTLVLRFDESAAALDQAAVRAAIAAELEHDAGLLPEQVERRALARQLSAGLDRLPLAQRVAFVLCEVEELSANEAAAVVGVPAATVRSRLFHAKRKLRHFLEGEA
ncbi:MAG: hypothetical protein OEZ06_12320 [Myxococcales bacterium]|nr:hypothetical protein [Myxococcales bacterium]